MKRRLFPACPVTLLKFWLVTAIFMMVSFLTGASLEILRESIELYSVGDQPISIQLPFHAGDTGLPENDLACLRLYLCHFFFCRDKIRIIGRSSRQVWMDGADHAIYRNLGGARRPHDCLAGIQARYPESVWIIEQCRAAGLLDRLV